MQKVLSLLMKSGIQYLKEDKDSKDFNLGLQHRFFHKILFKIYNLADKSDVDYWCEKFGFW